MKSDVDTAGLLLMARMLRQLASTTGLVSEAEIKALDQVIAALEAELTPKQPVEE